MNKSNHRLHHLCLLFGFLFLLAFLPTQDAQAQVSLKCQIFYDVEEGWTEVANVRVLQDNKEYETLTTSKKGKFKLFLPLGHDYLVEISKEYHYTTRFAISTKMPQAKLDQRPFVNYELQGDLIRAFEGLDASIMDKPILIYRYVPDQDAFLIDDDHLKAVRDRVDRLMDESDKLRSKGAKAVADPSAKEVKKVEEKVPEIKEAPVIEKEEIISEAVHEPDAKIEEEPEPVKEEVVPPPPPPVVKKEVTPKPVAVAKKEEPKERVNETAEMELRRQRQEREKKRKENLALKRGYESSLIRQVAEENKKMSRAEMQKRTQEKEDSSLIEKAKKEQELKMAREEQRKAQEMKEMEALQNKQAKSRMESGMIRYVAASNKVIAAEKAENEKKGEATENGTKFILEPTVREDKESDDFKVVENLYLDYPSYSEIYSKETYNFGMVNYYIDNRAVEKSEFCESLDQLKAYKFKLRCE